MGGERGRESRGLREISEQGSCISPENWLYMVQQQHHSCKRTRMIDRNFRHNGLLILATCVTAFCLLFAGTRVPDVARPQRPKPSPRAVIEAESKPTPCAVKKCLDVVAIVPKPVDPVPAPSFRAIYRVVSHPSGVTPLFPNSSRSPPLFPA